MLGARPIALTRRSDKTEALKTAGAAAVIATEEQDLVAEVMTLTNGEGAHLVFDPVAVTPLPMLSVLGRDVTIRSYGLAAVMRDDAQIEAMKRFVTEGLLSGALKPVIAHTFSLDEISDAHRHLEANGHVGKVIVTPS